MRLFWEQVIVGKYGQEEGSWCSKEVREGYEEGGVEDQGWLEAFKGRTSFKVSFKNRLEFWKDRWCGDTSLRETFPKL